MNPNQLWIKQRNEFRFNTGNRVRIIATKEVGVIKCCTYSGFKPGYMIELAPNKEWVTVKESEIESAPHA